LPARIGWEADGKGGRRFCLITFLLRSPKIPTVSDSLWRDRITKAGYLEFQYCESECGGCFNRRGDASWNEHAGQWPATTAAAGRPTAAGCARPRLPTTSATAHAVPPTWKSGIAGRTTGCIVEKEEFAHSQVPGRAHQTACFSPGEYVLVAKSLVSDFDQQCEQ
jgi:hypothetical protein